MQVFMLCPFYRYIDKRAAYALPPEILTYGDIFYISVPVPIFSQFNFSDAFIVLVVKIYYSNFAHGKHPVCLDKSA